MKRGILIAIIIVLLLIIILFLANKDSECYDCGEGGWQKMDIKCSNQIETKEDAIDCLSKQDFVLSQISNNVSYIQKKISQRYIKIGGYRFIEEPESSSIQVFGFGRWAVDSEENIYLESYLG